MTNQSNRSNRHTDNAAIRQARIDAMQEQTKSQKSHSTLDELDQIENEEIENEIGLEEVAVDSEDLNLIAADDVDEEEDLHASAVGDESVGGTVATPDQDIVDNLGTAVGLEVDDRAFLRTNDTLEERDDRRWELDPKSSEDYQRRN